ncbi:MAG: hypothetical protein ACRECD_14020 [Burkholderiaceae bacterium]
MKKIAILVLVAGLIGCATAPPNTPGAGYGQSYTPIVDMQGIDPIRYASDLDTCRKYSAQVDAGAASMNGALGGAIAMGLLSAMLGGSRNMNTQAATAGGFVGIGAEGGRAIGKQERIIINCMAGRGYRTLDAAMVTPSPYASSPYASSPYAQPAAQAYAPAAPAAISPAITPSNGITVAAKPRATGKDLLQAEQLAKDQACHSQPYATLAAKGPGFENYAVACSNGDTLMLRCEYGNCRALR